MAFIILSSDSLGGTGLEKCFFLRIPVGDFVGSEEAELDNIHVGCCPPIKARLVLFAAPIRLDSASLSQGGAFFPLEGVDIDMALFRP